MQKTPIEIAVERWGEYLEMMDDESRVIFILGLFSNTISSQQQEIDYLKKRLSYESRSSSS